MPKNVPGNDVEAGPSILRNPDPSGFPPLDTSVLNKFCPDWVSPPGDTIRDLLSEQQMSPEDLAQKMGIGLDSLTLLLEGRSELTSTYAESLARIFENSTTFWENRELHFRQGLARMPLVLFERHQPYYQSTATVPEYPVRVKTGTVLLATQVPMGDKAWGLEYPEDYIGIRVELENLGSANPVP